MNIFFNVLLLLGLFFYVKNIEIPTINKKKGNIKSVGESPFHLACNKGEYT
jgi:hypothetical protein